MKLSLENKGDGNIIQSYIYQLQLQQPEQCEWVYYGRAKTHQPTTSFCILTWLLSLVVLIMIHNRVH